MTFEKQVDDLRFAVKILSVVIVIIAAVQLWIIFNILPNTGTAAIIIISIIPFVLILILCVYKLPIPGNYEIESE